MSNVDTANLPFESAAAFEAAIAPYMKLRKPRHLQSNLWCRPSFRARLLNTGLLFTEMFEYRTRTKHPRLKFRGTKSHGYTASHCHLNTPIELPRNDQEPRYLETNPTGEPP